MSYHPNEWHPWMDWWKILIVILVWLWMLPACAPKPETQWTERTQLTGQCFQWNKIEKEIAGQVPCMKTTVNRSGRIWHCGRKRGHWGHCHAHLGQNCRWTWK